MNTLALSSGNSRMLAQAVLDGAASRGHHVELADLADSVRAPLRDCRVCRRPDGGCAIEDGKQIVPRSNVVWPAADRPARKSRSPPTSLADAQLVAGRPPARSR